MKILSCYIENFGKISKKEIPFDEGITILCEDNGYGKTTIAAFIKAMFYGLPTCRQNSKFNDRMHYYPFSGGKFGGNITIECAGKNYKIERFFDKKSETSDTLNVFDANGRRTRDLGGVPGKTLFGIDEASFLRTAFLTSEEVDAELPTAINAKLNNLVDNTDDVANFESAVALLESARKNLKADRGQNGKIDKTLQEITEIKIKLEALANDDSELKRLYLDRNRAAEQLENLNRQVEKLHGAAVEQAKWKTYDAYLSDAEDKKGEYEKLLTLCPGGLPTADELASVDEYAEELKQRRTELNCAGFSDDKQAELTQLDSAFRGGIPTDSELREIAEKIERADKAAALLEQEKRGSTQPDELLDKFRKGIPEKKVVQKVRESVKAYAENEEIIRLLSTSASPVGQTSGKNRLKSYILLLVLAALLLAAGGICCAFLLPLGISIMALGLIVGCLTGFLYLKRKMSSAVPYQTAETLNEINRLRVQNASLEKNIRAFLSAYGYYSDSPATDFALFERDLGDYTAFISDYTDRSRRLADLQAESEKSTAELKLFFGRFGIAEPKFSESLASLKSKLDQYGRLKKEQSDDEDKRTGLREASQKLTGQIDAVLGRYGIAFDDEEYKRVKESRQKADLLAGQIEELEKKAADYRAAEGLADRPAEEEGNAVEIEEACEKLRDEISRLNTQIDEFEDRLRELPDAEALLEQKTGDLAAQKDKYETLRETVFCLREAEQNLINRYLNPMKSSFLGYAEKMSQRLTEKMAMDPKFKISFERDGEQRPDKHLSAGQRCLCQLCLRFALIDNMYKAEKPFLILDDPFLSLDARHLENVLSVLKSLSSDRQIIYFCCHPSRKPAM